jgi:ribosomal protein S18 acetylase RimI-like enzyme
MPHIRPLVALDREAVRHIVEATGNFSDAEVATALELVDEWLHEGEASGYITRVIDEPERGVRGYVCYGPAPLTDGTYDLYWIAVDPAAQGRGYGQQLLGHAESDVRQRGGRLLLIETSSQATYSATIHFYKRAGYELAARIQDYYRPGDDKLVFAKRLAK